MATETATRAGPSLLTTAVVDYYTAPSTTGLLAVVARVHIASATGSAGLITVGINTAAATDPADGSKRIGFQVPISSGEILKLDPYFLASGATPDRIFAYADTAGAFTIAINVVVVAP
jgi:hypothetical protein